MFSNIKLMPRDYILLMPLSTTFPILDFFHSTEMNHKQKQSNPLTVNLKQNGLKLENYKAITPNIKSMNDQSNPKILIGASDKNLQNSINHLMVSYK